MRSGAVAHAVSARYASGGQPPTPAEKVRNSTVGAGNPESEGFVGSRGGALYRELARLVIRLVCAHYVAMTGAFADQRCHPLKRR